MKSTYDVKMPNVLEAMQKTVQNAAALVGAHYCEIALVDESGQLLVTQASWSAQDRKRAPGQFRWGEGLIGQVVARRTSLCVEAVKSWQQEISYADGIHFLRQTHPYGDAIQSVQPDPVTEEWLGGSLLCVPIQHGEIVLGVLIGENLEEGAFGAAQLQQMEIMADQAAMILMQAQRTEPPLKQLPQANFLSMITHELRSPLNSINGYLDLLLDKSTGELTDAQREYALRARSGSEQLYALLEDLFLISRADAGQLRLTREIVRLPDIISQATEELELTAADYDITLQIEVSNTLPPLYADAIRLQQVLRNLLSNALRFTPAGGHVQISATIEESQDETFAVTEDLPRVVALRVKDNGIGIAPEYQEQIFQRFFQVSAAGRSGGQGLGLAIVKMIVELHGGQVLVESQIGKGCTFTCLLPCLLT
ncbi:GAF domain-containing sensor histidine kinase [Tengunoibacter tsumagoiensis]|nr:GAF domain-containing sensor histidine kinase [Tengunoibacter tsumagoiensis]